MNITSWRGLFKYVKREVEAVESMRRAEQEKTTNGMDRNGEESLEAHVHRSQSD